LALFAGATSAAPKDPLESVQWELIYNRYFEGESVSADSRIKVRSMSPVEDALQLPVEVDATALGDVREIVLMIDYNPIPLVYRFKPLKAAAKISVRVKIQQSSPIRALVRTGDGHWYMHGLWVEAAGGGCTIPSMASADSTWADQLGEVYAGVWSGEQQSRVRLRVMHPMDTGLVENIPAFYIEKLQLADQSGVPLLQLQGYEPLSENPIFTFDLPGATDPKNLLLSTRDNAGNEVSATLP
jgi:sulfur-oxidizing protein SoxY